MDKGILMQLGLVEETAERIAQALEGYLSPEEAQALKERIAALEAELAERAQEYAQALRQARLDAAIDYNQNTITIDDISHSFTVTTFAPDYNMYLFACNQSGTAIANKYAIMRLYSCKIYDNGTLASNYIPCKNASGTAGLYDLVNSSFVSSATSIDLVAGTAQGNAVKKIKKKYVVVDGVAKLVFYGSRTGAYTAPESGADYTNGLSGLTAAQVSTIAAAISNNADITNTTSAVYYDGEGIHRKLSIGDQVSLALNGTNYAFDIIGFNHDTLTSATAYGAATATGRAGMTLQMHDLLGGYQMNSSGTNRGGWKSSAMRTSTIATMRGYLPFAWQSIIKPINKQAGLGGGSSSGVETVSDSCFLLAEIEIFGSTTDSVSGEGSQYAYYRAGNTTVKKKSGSAYDWWERSPCSYDSIIFCMVSHDGRAAGSAANVHAGVAFGFCV